MNFDEAVEKETIEGESTATVHKRSSGRRGESRK